MTYGVFILQVYMRRRVLQYLSKLDVITDEDKLREMSVTFEPPPGSGKKNMSENRRAKQTHKTDGQNIRTDGQTKQTC